MQMAVISVIEDARVETLSIRRFPGLKQLWRKLHTATPEMNISMGDYLNRLARALLDDSYQDNDPWIAKARVLFAQAQDKLRQQPHLLGNRRAARAQLCPEAHPLQSAHRSAHRALPRRQSLFLGIRGIRFRQGRRSGLRIHQAGAQVRQRDGDGQRNRRRKRRRRRRGNLGAGHRALPLREHWDESNGKTYNELEGKEPVSDPFHYSEWDYQIQLERPAWATVLEKRAKSGDLQLIDDITAKYKRDIHRMKFLLDAMQPQGVQRIRKLEDGDEIDINAAIASFIDIRMGKQPDPRIMMRSVRKTRDFSMLVLLDLSESTNETVQDQEYSVRELTQQACVLLADAINKVGDPFAIHGFCSDGRHDVEYYRFKDFDQHWNEVPKARLAGMTGQLSTRMGAAIRHAGHHLKLQRSAKKLLIVITDGEPADIDVRDPQYLRYDTKKAVEEVAP